MTAPDLPTWTVADDHEGEPTLWYGGTAVLRKLDLFRFIGGKNDRAKQAFAFHLWEALTAIHAPDEATVERLARVLWERIAHGATSEEEAEEHWRFTRLWYIDHAKAVLAALGGTSAQACRAVASMGEVTTTGLTAHPARPAAGYPIVQGRCPACGAASLFLGSGGYVTCASLSCTDPTLATDVLGRVPEPGVAS